MESKESGSNAGESVGTMFSKPALSRPMLIVPPRNAVDALTKTPADATPSPMTFISSFFAEQDSDPDCKSFSQLLAGAMVTPSPKFADIFNDSGLITSRSQSDYPAPPEENKHLIGNGNPGRSSIARFKTMTPARLPIPRSPYLTIPPGLSPTTLLDSPVLLSTGQAEPSPTTGTFPLPAFIHGSGSTCVFSSDASKEQHSDQHGSPTFVFKPFLKLGSNSLPLETDLVPFGLSHKQALAQVQEQAQAQFYESSTTSEMKLVTSTTAPSLSSLTAPKLVSPLQSIGSPESSSQALFESSLKTQNLQPLPCPPILVEKLSEDGYNWRKYGQKQVKGSEYPRSYYKCTHPSCPVKKKVERSYDGQITEIEYKGEHNHPKPRATRRLSGSASHLLDSSGRDGCFSFSVPGKFEGSNAIKKVDGATQVDAKCEMMPTISDPSSSSKVTFPSGVNGTPDLSSGSTSDDEDGSKIDDGDDNEPDSKRRRRERANEAVATVPLRTIREPRIVVQTTSDIDILDDGYRWRKYGQKVVKGNPHPRSYYKCTNHGCSVRKHVERSSTDPKAVITTYEGKHNHDVPASRNIGHSSQDYSRAASVITTAAAHTVTVAKPFVSLQDQIFLGKLLDDRLKATEGERMAMVLDLSSGGLRSGQLITDQCSRIQEVADASSQIPMNLPNSAIMSRSLEMTGSYMQNIILRPKEEQEDNHVIVSSLESMFIPVCQGLLLGP